eukprot:872627-Rhodomonas_salina.1
MEPAVGHAGAVPRENTVRDARDRVREPAVPAQRTLTRQGLAVRAARHAGAAAPDSTVRDAGRRAAGRASRVRVTRTRPRAEEAPAPRARRVTRGCFGA